MQIHIDITADSYNTTPAAALVLSPAGNDVRIRISDTERSIRVNILELIEAISILNRCP